MAAIIYVGLPFSFVCFYGAAKLEQPLTARASDH
jgi:hypothetical protein